MDVSLGPRWEEFVAEQVRAGRYRSADDMLREGLRLVEERDARLRDLREAIGTAIERGGRNTPEDLSRALDTAEAEMRRQAG